MVPDVPRRANLAKALSGVPRWNCFSSSRSARRLCLLRRIGSQSGSSAAAESANNDAPTKASAVLLGVPVPLKAIVQSFTNLRLLGEGAHVRALRERRAGLAKANLAWQRRDTRDRPGVPTSFRAFGKLRKAKLKLIGLDQDHGFVPSRPSFGAGAPR